MCTRAPGPGSMLALRPWSRMYRPPVWRSWLMVVNRPPPVPRNVSSVNVVHDRPSPPVLYQVERGRRRVAASPLVLVAVGAAAGALAALTWRSEERRVGKEGR